MSNIKNRKEDGFTIIEVLIVLAIAGLIMLIVFLAVPALQRNSRNTQRTNDVSAVLSGMTEYMNNNSGSKPATGALGAAGATTGKIGATGTNQVDVKLGYYTADKVSISSTVTTNPGDQESVTIVLAAKCNGNDAQTGTGAPSRGFVALYTLENNAKQCKES